MFAASKTSRRAAAALPDPFFDNVSLLLESSGTNGAQNNTFIDSSTNNFTITRNGNTTQGAFSPYGENWSVFFDGSGDSLSLASNAAFGYGTGAFTVECWFNTSSIPASGAAYLFDQRTTDLQAALLAYITTGASLEVFINGATITGGVVTVGTWNHFALSRSGTTTRMFLNGVQVGSSLTDNNNYGNQPVVIASRYTPENFFTGYISNFRIIKGTALYTANFTPSTVPLQPIQNTSLLTCRDANIVDDSANLFTITRNGNVSVQKFGPFAATTLPVPYYGAFFDGNGDYITAPANAVFQLTGDFTLEAWIYPTTVNNFNMVFGSENGANSDYLTIRASTIELAIANAAYPAWSFSFTTGRWYHIAITRSSNTLRAFVDGTVLTLSGGSATNSSQMFQSGAPIAVGRYGNTSNPLNFTGYISNARIVKGQALYTSAFTPSTVPLTTTSQGATASNVSLLTCQSNTFIDNSPNSFAITAFGESRPTAFAPFSVTYLSQQPYTPSVFGGSMYLDGTGDSLNTPSSTAFGFGTGDFTMECWVYPTVNARQDWIYLTNGSQLVLLYYNGSNIAFFSNPPNATVITGPAMTLNAWAHVAVSRSSGSIRLFVNGIQAGTTYTTSQNYGTTITATIGRDALGSAHATGYISSVRIVKGTGLYNSNFVPQNTPFTAVTNTSLLLNATNAGIYDASTINDFETVGNAQVNTSIKRYGLSSIAFDGNGDSLDVRPMSPGLFSQRGAYTIEMWIYPTNLSVAQYFYSQVTTNFLQLAINGTGRVEVDRSGVGVAITSSSSLTINTWQYVTLVSDGTNLRLYINGTQSGSTVSVGTQADPSSAILRIGAYQNNGGSPTFPFYGNIQDFRITRGIARYTTTFTPPAAPLPDF